MSDSIRGPGGRWAHLRNQRGASLYIALAAIVVVVGIVAPLAMLSATSVTASRVFSNEAQRRNAADSSMKAAINHVARNPDLGRDPAIYPGDPDCGYRVPASETGSASVSVTCEAATGSDSGSPNQTGKVPDQSILLLGQRYGDVGPYSPCTGSATDRGTAAAREVGLVVDPTALRQVGSTTECVDNNGAVNTDVGFKVAGDIRSNAPVRVRNGSRLTLDSGTIQAGTSPLFYLNASPAACTGTILNSSNGAAVCTPVATSRPRNNPNSGSASDPFNPGETLFTDPALDSARGAEWRQGKVNWTAPRVSFNGAAPVALTTTTTISCTKNRNLIRFYPGFYTSAAALNRIFATTACTRGASGTGPGIFWFGPAENNSNGTPSSFSLDLLGSSGTPEQGVYTFDFRDTSGGTACALLPNTNYPRRWCLYPDASNDNGPIVIGGWPKGWEPAGVVAAPANSTSPTQTVTLSQPQEFNTDGSQTWDAPSNSLDYNGSSTFYRPTALISTNRSMILGRFGTVRSVQPNGTISIRVRHQESRSGRLNKPELVLSTTDRGVPVSCGTYVIPKSTDTFSQTADALQTNTISTDPALDPTTVLSSTQRNQLRDCFSNPDRIANLRIRWQVTGDTWNVGTCNPTFGFAWLAPLSCGGSDDIRRPRVFLEGVQISVDVPTGGFFTADAPLPATYCDPDEPGVQFVFGGDSSVHVGTAALQLCAGPTPSTPESFQQIALWGQPVNYLTKQNGSSQTETRVGKTGSSALVPTGAASGRISCDFICIQDPSWSQAQRAVRAGNPYTEPANPSEPIKADLFSGRSTFGSTNSFINLTGFGKIRSYGSSGCQVNTPGDRATNLCLDSTQQVSRVVLKTNYNTACDPLFSSGFLCSSLSADVDVKIGNGSTDWCNLNDALDARPRMSWGSVDVTSCLGADSATRVSRINDANFRVRLELPCNFPCFNNNKQVEGVELLVTTTGTGNAVTPTTGCHLAEIGYGSGVGDPSVASVDFESRTNGPDCALISGSPPLVAGDGTITRPGGRVSIQGTIYAPNSALEVADGDVAYPFASRGIVARHLRVRGMQFRPPYNEPSITTNIDKAPNDRLVALTACVRAADDISTPCGDLTDDVVLSRAGVRFTTDESPAAAALSPEARVRVPQVVWWNNQRQ